MHRNVLLLVADDLGKQLGCYGCPYIQTPNIDRLAAEGVRFDYAFASTASCSGSRSTLYTGLHTHQNGQYGLQSGRHHFQTYDAVQTAPALLARRGVYTGIVGKVHVGPDAVYPWDYRAESLTRDVVWSAARAADFLAEARRRRRPFFLTVAFHDPHRDRTRAGFGNDEPVDPGLQPVRYRPEDVVVPDFLGDSPGVRQELAAYAEAISRLDQGVGRVLQALADHEALADEGGDGTTTTRTLVVFLSDNGPPFLNAKTTLFEPGIRLPLIVRQPGGPAAVANPSLVSFVDVLPTLLDWALGPEAAAAAAAEAGQAGQAGFAGFAGRSFLPVLGITDPADAAAAGWDHVFGSHTFHEVTNYWPTRFLRTARYKYHRNIAWRLDFPLASDLHGSLTWDDVRNGRAGGGDDDHDHDHDDDHDLKIGQRPLRDYFFRPPEQLFDLDADPAEVRDVAPDPAYAAVLRDLRARLEDWQRRTGDPWLFRDGVSLVQSKYLLEAGLALPDAWDLDVDHPGTGDHVAKYVDKPFGEKGGRS